MSDRAIAEKEGAAVGSYVLLLKEYEDDEKVIYRFGPDEKRMGTIQLNKVTGKFTELEAIRDSTLPSRFYFDRAAVKLSVCHVREKGMFPERMAFES